MSAHIAAETHQQRNKVSQRHHGGEVFFDIIHDHPRDETAEQRQQEPGEAGFHRFDDLLEEAVVLIQFIFVGTGHTQNVLGSFFFDNVENIVDGDDPHQMHFLIGNGNRHNIVTGDERSDFFLVGIVGNGFHAGVHNVADGPVGRRNDEIS